MTTAAHAQPNTPTSASEPGQPSQSLVNPASSRPDMPPTLLPATNAPMAAPAPAEPTSSAR